MARLGVKIFYLRTREQRLSQQQVADRLGIRQATLSHIERGASLPNCALLGLLCRFFDVTPTWLLDDARSVVPRPTERWSLRDSLVTVGMFVEVPAGRVERLAGDRLLCPLLAREAFYDAEAAARRRESRDDEGRAAGAIDRLISEREAGERALAGELEDELHVHPRRRPGLRD